MLLSSMDAEADATGFSQRSAYDELFGTLRAALADALSKGPRRLLATYLQTLRALASPVPLGPPVTVLPSHPLGSGLSRPGARSGRP